MQVRDIVRVYMPATYGRIIAIRESKVGVSEPYIRYMSPIKGLMGKIRHSVYAGDFFTEQYQVIDPEVELNRIKIDGQTPNGAPLEASVKFLSEIVDKKQQKFWQRLFYRI